MTHPKLLYCLLISIRKSIDTGDNNECPDVLLSRPASRRSGCSLKGATMNRPQHRLQANPEAVRKVTGPVDKKVFVPCQAARANTTGRPRGPSNN